MVARSDTMGVEISFGITIPQWASWSGAEGCRRIATAAEEFGYDWVGSGDHIVFSEAADSWDVDLPTLDVFATLSFVAGATERITIGSNICVVPYRHPVTLAKQAISLDVLSQGRFEFGVGSGWCESEFTVLDVPHHERGSRTDEFLALFDRACTEPIIDFCGPHHEFSGVGFYPRPCQDGGPPVMVGGFSAPAFRRTAEFGDGWTLGTGDPSRVAEARKRITTAWDDFDRDGEPAIAVNFGAHIDDSMDPDEHDSPLVGPTDAVIAGVEAFLEAGATRVSPGFTVRTDSIDEQVEQIERFATAVMPSFN